MTIEFFGGSGFLALGLLSTWYTFCRNSLVCKSNNNLYKTQAPVKKPVLEISSKIYFKGGFSLYVVFSKKYIQVMVIRRDRDFSK